ncbi:MAG: VOC family protein [Gemmatimonadetes bacterium]|nr:VOC family protein [Gemmatimonadota bacterium]
MSDLKYGAIGWVDLTVPNAGELRDFYSAVAGWSSQDVKMGDYADYTMRASADGEAIAGVCHARGSNTGMPAQWLMYVSVPDLDASLAECVKRGGKVYREKKSMGSYGDFAVIQDPAGAVMGLIQPKTA